MTLAVDIHRLLKGGLVEWERIDFYRTFHSSSILHSICAFANDMSNAGGGYIVIGVDVDDRRRPILPPTGLSPGEVKVFKDEVLHICHYLKPHYSPIVDVVDYKDKKIILLWVPTGVNRPYRAPRGLVSTSEYFFYIRKVFQTKKATVHEEIDLMAAANQTPFDSQLHHLAQVTDLNVSLIQEYLAAIKSNLLVRSQENDIPFLELCQRTNIVGSYGDEIRPKNIALLLFNNNPQNFFPQARIEVTEFDEFLRLRERTFDGPLIFQINTALNYIKGMVISKITERRPRAGQRLEYFNYPFKAIQEALINAVYHRSFKENAPIEVRVLPKGIEIISWPGPLPPLDNQKLKLKDLSARMYRNPLLGFFLKQLRMVRGKATGLEKISSWMQNNGNPSPSFTTDKKLKYFKVFLPIHPQFAPNLSNSGPLPKPIKEINKIVPRLYQVCPKNIDLKNAVLVLLTAQKEVSLEELMFKLNQTNKTRFRNSLIKPLMDIGLLEYTITHKPKSGKQKYIITEKARADII